jgi:hypothetical protein
VRKRFGIDDGRDVKRWSFDAMGQVLVLLAGCAALDVLSDPCPCAGPEVFPVYLPNCFVSSGVSTKWSVVPGVHEFTFQPLVWRDDETVCFNISPEWGVRGIYSFDGEYAFPFLHESVMGVLDGGDGIFQGSVGVGIKDADEDWFREHDHLLVVVFACISSRWSR